MLASESFVTVTSAIVDRFKDVIAIEITRRLAPSERLFDRRQTNRQRTFTGTRHLSHLLAPMGRFLARKCLESAIRSGSPVMASMSDADTSRDGHSAAQAPTQMTEAWSEGREGLWRRPVCREDFPDKTRDRMTLGLGGTRIELCRGRLKVGFAKVNAHRADTWKLRLLISGDALGRSREYS
jgi:hypothetical protein